MSLDGAKSLLKSELSVTVAIPTFKRPELLDRLLMEVSQQADRLASLTGGRVRILVADNDPDGSARAVVDRHPRVDYLAVPTPGIAAVRSACLGAASSDVLQFIDDDEQPDPDWLVTMVGCWVESERPAALAGSVLPRFDSPPSEWITAGRFFERRRPATGTFLPAAPAGNLLLGVEQVRELGVDFDPRLGLRGGEDTLFTRQLAAAGGTIRFCREGIIYDLVPDARNSREWVLSRAWHQGATTSSVALWELRGIRRLVTSASLVAGGFARFAVGQMRSLWGRATGSAVHDARGARLSRRGLGMAAGAVRQSKGEYARAASTDAEATTNPALAGPAFGERLKAALESEVDVERGLGLVVVNYGASELLQRNLPAGLAEAAGAKVTVVDNLSSDDERNAVRRLSRERGWILVEPDRNLGFGEGVNAGVLAAAESGCRVFVTLNPDASANAEVLRSLKRVIEDQPRALVSPKVVSSDGMVRFSGTNVSLFTGQMRRGWVPGDDDPEWKNWLTGACLGFTGGTFAELGGFAEEYFLYWEDVDLSRRAAESGMSLVLCADLQVVHDEGGTHTEAGSRAKSPLYYYYNTRNRLIFGARFAPAGHQRRWLLSTPRESTLIWLRGGRRQLLSRPGGALAAVRGSVEGLWRYRYHRKFSPRSSQQ